MEKTETAISRFEKHAEKRHKLKTFEGKCIRQFALVRQIFAHFW